MENLTFTQEVKPPNSKKGPVKWLKDNLFNTWYNTILTCLGLVFLFFVFKGVFTWIFTQADWEVIPANLQIFSIGPYPLEQIWRVSTVIYGLAVLLGLSAGIWNGIDSTHYSCYRLHWCNHTPFTFSYICPRTGVNSDCYPCSIFCDWTKQG